MATTETIRIGNHVLPVVPQKHARLRNRLSAEDFQKIMSSNYAAESYRILSVLIPRLPDTIPLWEWEGYGSQEQMDNQEYIEDLDNSPTTAEIVNAFETALMVSGAGRLGKIVDLVGAAGNLTKSTPTPTLHSPASPGSDGE
jgi:hypothetical protein